MNADLIAQIRTYIGDYRRGLPEEVFRLVSELTPLVNVDLLIKDGMVGRSLHGEMMNFARLAYSRWHTAF